MWLHSFSWFGLVWFFFCFFFFWGGGFRWHCGSYHSLLHDEKYTYKKPIDPNSRMLFFVVVGFCKKKKGGGGGGGFTNLL